MLWPAAGAALSILVWLAFDARGGALPMWLRALVAGSLFVLGPGAIIICGLTAHVSRLRRLALAAGFGIAACPVLASTLEALHRLDWYPFVAAALGGAALGVWHAQPHGPRPSSSRATLTAALVVMTAGLTVGGVAYAHRLEERAGSVTVTGEYDTYDLTYYGAIAGELAHTMPPHSPFFSGRLLNHSFYPHVVIALVHRFADVPLLDLYFRYAFPLCLGLAALLCFVFVEGIASTRVALLAALFLILSSDLSYLAAWFFRPGGWDDVVWSANFLSPGAETLFFNNWTPTLCVVFAGLVALVEAERSRGAGWLVIAAAGFAVTVLFKPFAFALVLAGLGGAVLSSFGDRRTQVRYLACIGTTLVLSLPFLYRVIALAEDTQVTFELTPFPLPLKMMERLEIDHILGSWAEAAGAHGMMAMVIVGLLGTPLFFIGGLGYRLAGIPGVWRALRRPADARPISRVLAWAIVAAILLPFGFSSVPYHETMQVHQFALYLLPIFVSQAVFRATTRRKQIAAIAVLSTLAVPSTAHFVHRKWTDHERPFETVRRSEMPVVRLLAATDPETTVVLHSRPSEPSLVAIMAGRRSVLSWSRYVRNSGERRRQVDTFFRPPGDDPALSFETLALLRPTHVIEDRARDRIDPAVTALLDLIYQNADVALYAVPADLATRAAARER